MSETKTTGYWFCRHDGQELCPESVTFEELHDSCGHPARWVEFEEHEMVDVNREVAEMYRTNQWPAVVTSNDRTRQVRGLIDAVGATSLTVITADGSVETFRHDDVLEIFPDHANA